jgi:threonine dehydrogenase-like Zn-dependent dehydrogenase
VELARIDLPDPGPGQALIRTTLSTICGSDLHIRDDIPEVPVGMPMGHEGVGVIEAVGEGVTRFKRGDRVVSCCLQSCGTCEECTTLEPSVCSTFGAPMNLLFGCQGEAFLVVAPHTPRGCPTACRIGSRFTADVSTGFGASTRRRAPVKASQSSRKEPVVCAPPWAHYYGASRSSP